MTQSVVAVGADMFASAVEAQGVPVERVDQMADAIMRVLTSPWHIEGRRFVSG